MNTGKRECACGCGMIINELDSHNRPRLYVKGHQNFGRVHKKGKLGLQCRNIRKELKNNPKALAELDQFSYREDCDRRLRETEKLNKTAMFFKENPVIRGR
jgi:hypothetical protein